MKVVRPALYLVGTPIGNLDDFSPRGVEILTECDFIAAEDTRVSAGLLAAFGIKKPVISYFEHNKSSRGENIVSRISEGQCCALITDAGMPAISDPGEDLVKLCAQTGIPVYVVPGPSAVVSALAVSGLSTSRFVFEGFPDARKTARVSLFESLASETRTMVFYEAPHKLKSTLADMRAVFGDDRKISLARELTKLHEEVIRTTLSGAAELYETVEPKGEFVLVVEGAQKSDTKPEFSKESAALYFSSLCDMGVDRKTALKETAEHFGVPKSAVYDACMKKQI